MDANQPTSDDQRTRLQHLAEGVHRLAVLVDELLERTSRLEAYTLELEVKLRTQMVLCRELERRVQTNWQTNARLAPLEEAAGE